MNESVEPSETPLGFCRKCKRQPLMKMNGKPRCPSCDVVPEEPSGRVVNVTVDDTDFKPVVNVLGFIERVPIDDPRPVATQAQISAAQALLAKEGKTGKPERTPPVTPLPSVLVSSAASPQEGLLTLSGDLLVDWLRSIDLVHENFSLELTESQLESLYEFMDTLPVPKSMKEARKLIQVQDRITLLLRRS